MRDDYEGFIGNGQGDGCIKDPTGAKFPGLIEQTGI